MKKGPLLFWSMLLVFSLSTTLLAESGPTLADWLDRALQKNPNYLLSVKDYQLSLEDLHDQETGGATKVSFSLGKLMLTEAGFQDNYSAALNYGWRWPNDLEVFGSLNTGELSNPHLTGDLGLSLNLLDFLRADKHSELAVKYRAAEEEMFAAQAGLIKAVVNKYYQIFQCRIDLALAKVELQLAEAQLEQGKKHYAAGRISAFDYYQITDQVESLTTGYQEAGNSLRSAKRDFARLYGLEVTARLKTEIDQLPLKPETINTHLIDEFIQEFDTDKISQYLENIYSYQKALLAVEERRRDLEEALRADQWQITLGTSVDYGSSQEDFGVSGTISLGKELYNPDNKRQIRTAKTELARAELALAETRVQLTYQLVGVIEEIGDLSFTHHKALEDFTDAREEKQRLEKQYAAGFIAQNDLLAIQITLREKEQALVESQLALLNEKLALSRLLSLDLLSYRGDQR